MPTLEPRARQRLIEASEIRTVFTPSSPIKSVEFFVGRERELNQALDALGTPGAHPIVYGARGIGKSSFANVVRALHKSAWPDIAFAQRRCDSRSTFASIFSDCLQQLGIDVTPIETSKTYELGGEGKIGVPFVGGGGRVSVSSSIVRRPMESELTPALVGSRLAEKRALVIIDEFDTLSNPEDRRAIGELIKHLSDTASPAKLVIVGVASSCDELLQGHPSSLRAIRQVHLGPMAERDLRQILERGAKKSRVRFTELAIDEIVELSGGYPYFTHLLALKCAELVVTEYRPFVDGVVLEKAKADAVQDAEQSLRESYFAAIRSTSSPLYGHILEVAAILLAPALHREEVSIADIQERLQSRLGQEINRVRVRSHMRELTMPAHGMVLRQSGRGIFRFTDPRMKSFVLIAMRRGSG